MSSGAMQGGLGVQAPGVLFAGTTSRSTSPSSVAEGLSLEGIPGGEGWLQQGTFIPSAGLSHPKLFSA